MVRVIIWSRYGVQNLVYSHTLSLSLSTKPNHDLGHVHKLLAEDELVKLFQLMLGPTDYWLMFDSALGHDGQVITPKGLYRRAQEISHMKQGTSSLTNSLNTMLSLHIGTKTMKVFRIVLGEHESRSSVSFTLEVLGALLVKLCHLKQKEIKN